MPLDAVVSRELKSLQEELSVSQRASAATTSSTTAATVTTAAAAEPTKKRNTRCGISCASSGAGDSSQSRIVGAMAAGLVSDFARNVTGSVCYVDAGYHVIS